MIETGESGIWLTVESCTKKYGSIIALDSVSFTAGRGVTILHGRNGSGKGLCTHNYYCPFPIAPGTTLTGYGS